MSQELLSSLRSEEAAWSKVITVKQCTADHGFCRSHVQIFSVNHLNKQHTTQVTFTIRLKLRLSSNDMAGDGRIMFCSTYIVTWRMCRCRKLDSQPPVLGICALQIPASRSVSFPLTDHDLFIDGGVNKHRHVSLRICWVRLGVQDNCSINYFTIRPRRIMLAKILFIHKVVYLAVKTVSSNWRANRACIIKRRRSESKFLPAKSITSETPSKKGYYPIGLMSRTVRKLLSKHALRLVVIRQALCNMLSSSTSSSMTHP